MTNRKMKGSGTETGGKQKEEEGREGRGRQVNGKEKEWRRYESKQKQVHLRDVPNTKSTQHPFNEDYM